MSQQASPDFRLELAAKDAALVEESTRARGLDLPLVVEAGMTHVNDSPVNDDANTAFGGEKASGIGRFGGAWAVEEFTTDHWVTVQREPRSFPI